MTEITHCEDIQYNKRAAKSFKKAFDLFKENEDKYKNLIENFMDLCLDICLHLMQKAFQ